MPSRREFLQGAVGTAAASLAPARGQSRPSRPNILFLMSDQHRVDCVGAYGNKVIKTPNLDALAQQGTLFRNAYSSTPTCTPARSSLLTGLSPWNHGMLGMGRCAQKYPLELPRVLGEAGYYTAGIGKMHWSPQRNGHGFHELLLDESGRVENPDFRSDYRSWFYSQAPNLDPDATGIGWNDHRGKAYVLPEELHPSYWIAETAVRFLNTYQRPEPFFLKVSWERPHSPYDPPQRWFDAYKDADLPTVRSGKWADRYQKRSSMADDLWHGNLGPAETRTSRQGYYGVVSHVDEQIGRVINALEKRGWLENTLILFVSDHGDMTGDQNLWRKSYAYEQSAHVPLIVRAPKGMDGINAGVTSDYVAELRDVVPTFLEAAGVKTARHMDGQSLLPVMRGKAEARPWIDLEHDVCYSPANHWNALTDGKSKYIFHARDGEEQFFDLANDPYEQKDLAGDTAHAANMRLWRERLTKHLAVRGERWVKNGQLALRPERQLYGPNFPGTPVPATVPA